MSSEATFDLRLPEGEDCQDSTLGTLPWQERLPALLRILGTAVLLVTMYSFLVDGWRGGNDSLRYLLMLGHTGALALIGLASLRWLREAKGARLLLSLALVSVPANFAILGALIYSRMPGVDPSSYPDYIAWQATSLAGAGVLTLAATLLLVPLTLFGFRVLARPVASGLSGLFLVNSALLLVPLRESELVTWGVTIALLATVWLLRTLDRGRHTAGTREGMLALILPFLPLAILMVRSLWLYSLDFFLVAAACLGIYLLLRQLGDWCESGSGLRTYLEMLSVLPALVMAIPVGGMLAEAGCVRELVAPLAGVASAALFYDLAARSTNTYFYRWLGAALVVGTHSLSLIVFGTLLAAAVTAISGVALFGLALRYRQRGLLLAGAILVSAAVIHQLGSLVIAFELGSWMGLAALGILAIVLASVLESRGGRLAQLVSHRWRQLAAWES